MPFLMCLSRSNEAHALRNVFLKGATVSGWKLYITLLFFSHTSDKHMKIRGKLSDHDLPSLSEKPKASQQYPKGYHDKRTEIRSSGKEA